MSILKSPAKNDGVIWRYMDTARFVAMLEDRALHFANAVSFEDPFEGSIPLKNLKTRIALLETEFESAEPFKEFYERLTTRSGVTIPDPAKFIAEQVGHKVELREKLLAQSASRDKALEAWIVEHNFSTHKFYWDRQNIFINCWHESEIESAAMWKLYSNNEHSVCIKSRISRLQGCLTCLTSSISISRVKYIDFSNDEIEELNQDVSDTFIAHRYKRSSFSHEREVRAMFASFDHLEKQGEFSYGMPLKKLNLQKPVDLDALIEGIFVAPSSPSWYRSLIQKLAIRYGLSIDVKMSSLVADPLY